MLVHETESRGALFSKETWHSLASNLKLSDREFQIVQQIFDDQKEAAIAVDLGISPHTVNTYLQRLYHKLGVASRVQLIVRIVAEYLTMPAPSPMTPDEPSLLT